MTRPCSIPVAMLLLCAPAALAGQRLPVELGVHAAVASPSAAYAAACEHVHPALGVEARTRGARYLAATVGAYGAGGGADVGCSAWTHEGGSSQLRIGGLELDGAVRIGAGAGRRAGAGPVQLAVEGTLGGIRGRPGYTRHDGWEEPGPARWLPWAGATVSATLFRHLTVGWNQSWTRLAFREEVYPPPPPWGTAVAASAAGEGWIAPPRRLSTIPTDPSEVRDRPRWAPMGELRAGVRF